MAILGGSKVESDAMAVKRLLLSRLTNSAGNEFRKSIIALTGSQRDEGGLAIRTRLKVEQVKTARADQPNAVKLNKTHLLLPAPVLHQLLQIMASESSSDLSNLTAVQMQAVLRACVSADSDLPSKLLTEKAKGVKKPDLQAALVQKLGASDEFQRFHFVSQIASA